MASESPYASCKGEFGEVALTEMPVLYRVARRLTGSDSDAEDLVGSTLLQAMRSWSSFDGRHVRAWLIRILRNVHASELRRRSRRPIEVPELEQDPGDEGFWKEIDFRIVGEQAIAALDGLAEEFRMAVALVDVEEMDHCDAAAALDIPEATLRTRLFRGRKKLRAKLVQYV